MSALADPRLFLAAFALGLMLVVVPYVRLRAVGRRERERMEHRYARGGER